MIAGDNGSRSVVYTLINIKNEMGGVLLLWVVFPNGST
jgi:hypothetical protein